MKRDGCRHAIALLAALVCSFVTYFIIYRVFGFSYVIGDDILMRDIASGAFTGTPNGHLIFIQYVLGFLISRLYMLNRSVDWYGFLLVGAMFLGITGILYRGFAARKSLRWKGIYGGIVLCVFVIVLQWHVMWFEWTVSAVVTGSSALYLYATSITDKKSERIFDGVLIWFLLIVTILIRQFVFYMILPGFGITFLWRFFKRDGKRFHFVHRELVLPGLVFLCFGVIALVENLAYQGEKWEEFERFSSFRSQVYDYSDTMIYDANPAYFDNMGLDEHDVRNLRHYSLYLVEGMDTEMMQQLSWEREIEKRGSKSRMEYLWEQLKNGVCLSVGQMVRSTFSWISIPLFLLLCGTVLLAFFYKKDVLAPLFLFIAVESALWLMLGMRGRLPERVSYSQYFVSFMGVAGFFYQLIFMAEKEIEVKKRREKQILVTGVLGICLCAAVIRSQLDYRYCRKEPSSYQRFKDACKDDTDRIYFIETIAADAYGGAMVTAHGDFRMNRCITLGDWYSYSPLDEERFEIYGIENVEEAILTDPRVYLVMPEVEDPGMYDTYFTHKYPDVEVICRECKVVYGVNYYLFQVRRQGNQ